MYKLILIILTLVPFVTKAQVTLIPDPMFEQRLVSLGIDSDGVVNGQILTADAQSVLYLNLGHSNIVQDFSGLDAFVNVEHLYGSFNAVSTINITTLTKLKTLGFKNNGLYTVDLAGNKDLEILDIGNNSDMWQLNDIPILDLSNNTKLKLLGAKNLSSLGKINLKNHSADSLRIGLGNDLNYPYKVCIEVDDPVAATNGTAPYDTWTITNTQNGSHFFSMNCALSIEKFVNDNFKIYPNPATDYVSIQQKTTDGVTLESVQILDSSGKWIKSVKDHFNKIDVSNLSKGMYLFVIQTDKGNKTEKIIVK